MRRCNIALVWLGTLLLLGGCSSGLPDMAKVSGTVTIDGKSAPGGTVQFVPETEEGEEIPPAVSTIDENGHYELETAGKRDPIKGAAVGFHKVRLDIKAKPRDEKDTLPPSLIPTKYNDPNKSGLRYEVVAGKDNVIDIPLLTAP